MPEVVVGVCIVVSACVSVGAIMCLIPIGAEQRRRAVAAEQARRADDAGA